jgi:hypothetical protein
MADRFYNTMQKLAELVKKEESGLLLTAADVKWLNKFYIQMVEWALEDCE